MNEHLSITIPRGYGHVQSLADGSLQVTLDMGDSPHEPRSIEAG